MLQSPNVLPLPRPDHLDRQRVPNGPTGSVSQAELAVPKPNIGLISPCPPQVLDVCYCTNPAILIIQNTRM